MRMPTAETDAFFIQFPFATATNDYLSFQGESWQQDCTEKMKAKSPLSAADAESESAYGGEKAMPPGGYLHYHGFWMNA